MSKGAIANTKSAKDPRTEAEDVIPERRSSKILGIAKVVPWKITLEIAVVKNTTIETLKIKLLNSSEVLKFEKLFF